MKRLARIGNMMQSIRRTVWLLAISNDAGMNGLRKWRVLKTSLRVVRDKQPPALTDAERAEILALGSDLRTAVEPSGGLGCHAEEDFACSARRDHRHRGTWSASAQVALEGRRPHLARSCEEPHGAASLEDQCCNRTADLRSRARAAGWKHRVRSQSAWSTDRKGSYVDATTRANLPQRPWRCGLPRR